MCTYAYKGACHLLLAFVNRDPHSLEQSMGGALNLIHASWCFLYSLHAKSSPLPMSHLWLVALTPLNYVLVLVLEVTLLFTPEKRSPFCVTVLGKFLGIDSQDRSDSKSNRLHVDIFQFCFHSFEVNSLDSSKMISKFLEVLNFNWLFLLLNQFICN